MREDLERLLELQKIDVVLNEAVWEAEDLPKRIAELEEQLSSADALVTEAEAAMETMTRRLESFVDIGARLQASDGSPAHLIEQIFEGMPFTWLIILTNWSEF